MVTATDEDELAARIRKAEEENAEVSKPYISQPSKCHALYYTLKLCPCYNLAFLRLTVTRTTRTKWEWVGTRMWAVAVRMMRTIRRKAQEMKRGAMRSELESLLLVHCDPFLLLH